MNQTLSDKLNAVTELGHLRKEISADIFNNLSQQITLRPYQATAIERFLYFIEDFPQRPLNVHLLFHMATGSGKTVLMASLILDLYKRGYRNFIFFVNSTQIIEKTKANFLNSGSSKYLFAPQLQIDNRRLVIQAVENFEAISDDVVNIHFTTIQGLHTRIQNPIENSITIEDFRNHKVVLLSDEAHHLNTETKRNLNKSEIEEKNSWEGTVTSLFNQHPENMLLEFTATVDMDNSEIRRKYQDKILYDYSLRQFRMDGYSKDIELRQADLPPQERMMQAMVLSQYRRKVAEAHGIHCKPVILMKSRTIRESSMNEKTFLTMVNKLNGEILRSFRENSTNDQTMSRALSYIMDERGIDPTAFALELLEDFSPENVINVNEPIDLETQQIELNTLESNSNELRVIFAVDKLNEGWDVLNLFDIVRLYDTRDTKGNKVGPTTMAEAQLLGRGARYFPFKDPNQQDVPMEKRKFDDDATNSLRVLEELHYHCSHNPKYIQEIRSALRNTGMIAAEEQTITIRLKDSFKDSLLYQKGVVWTNQRIKNDRRDISSLRSYKVQTLFSYDLTSAQVIEISAFDDDQKSVNDSGNDRTIAIDLKLTQFGTAVLGFAVDTNEFFHFQNLRTYFPQLTGISEFLTNETYLGGVTVTILGTQKTVDNLSSRQKLDITRRILHQIEMSVIRESSDYKGTRRFTPHKISDCFTDVTLKLRLEGETGRSWNKGQSNVERVNQIDLLSQDWHVYDDSYGTDQEKHFITFINDRLEQLRSHYDNFYLLRNEKAVKLFAINDGRGFEPDYVLFLLKRESDNATVLQLFIEPKGRYLIPQDGWKETLLRDIEFETVFEDDRYIVYGLPFFNSNEEIYREFKETFNSFLEDTGGAIS